MRLSTLPDFVESRVGSRGYVQFLAYASGFHLRWLNKLNSPRWRFGFVGIGLAPRYIEVMNQAVATHIELRLNRAGQARAFISGTRVRVQDIYAQAEIYGYTPEEIVESLPHLSLGQVHAALSYLYDHREAIVQEMREDDAFALAMKARFGSGPLAAKLRAS
jgi:uncharacterized protein (DUF433 family)